MQDEFKTNELNPYGMHFLKFTVCLSLLVIHSYVWVGEALRVRFVEATDSLHQFTFLLSWSMLVPLVAGAIQAIALKDRLHGGKLHGFSLRPFAFTLLFLALLESAKAALLYGPGYFFAWNVMHMICVSLVVVLFLSRFSIFWVAASAAAAVLATPALRGLFVDWQVKTPAEMDWLLEAGFGKMLFGGILSLALILALVYLYRTPKLLGRYKLRIALLLVVAFDLLLFLSKRAEYHRYTAARILNLPAGALVGDQLGFHFWPLFPWYSTVAFGFIFYYWFPRARNPRAARWLIGALASALLSAYLMFFSKAVVGNLSHESIWDPALFAGSLGMLLMILGVFLTKALLYDSLSRSPRVQTLVEKYPPLFRVPFVYSKTIFWAYLWVNSAGIPLATPFAKFLPERIALWAYPLFMALTWYWLGEFVIRILGRLKFQVKLSAARAPA